MANAHTKDQRKWIIERLAYGYTAEVICRKFMIRFADTKCAPDDVYRCDPSIVLLSPEEFEAFTAAVRFADENPEMIAPALDPVRRQISLVLMAEHERDRGAFDAAAKYYEQVAKEQAGAYAPKGAKPSSTDSKDKSGDDGTITWKVVRPEDAA